MASKFLDSVRRFMRLQGYSIRTEHTYLHWIRLFIRFNGLRHPEELGAYEVGIFFLGWQTNGAFPLTRRKLR